MTSRLNIKIALVLAGLAVVAGWVAGRAGAEALPPDVSYAAGSFQVWRFGYTVVVEAGVRCPADECLPLEVDVTRTCLRRGWTGMVAGWANSGHAAHYEWRGAWRRGCVLHLVVDGLVVADAVARRAR